MALIAAYIPIGVEAADSFMGLLGDRDRVTAGFPQQFRSHK